MKLATTYLGFKLRTPLLPSASPLSENLDNIKRMEDAGASAVVFHSLFEEQLHPGNYRMRRGSGNGDEFSSDAVADFSNEPDFKVNPEAYLNHIAKAKAAVKIPIIGSLNGSTFGGWQRCARQIEQAGADALELNIYTVPTDPDRTADDIETDYLTIVASVKGLLKIPLAVKLSRSSPIFPGLRNAWTKPAQTRWCCSTAFISLTLNSRHWRSAQTCCSTNH
jgi:dihydroorotate dehydrogenase (fumarate)